MAVRRGFVDDNSLELLLDTVTNAFGGILFLAILVVVLLQGTSKRMDPHDRTPPVNARDLSDQLEQVKMVEATLARQLEAMDTISSNLADSELRATLAQLQHQRQVRDELVVEKARLQRSIASSEKKLDGIEKQNQSLTDEIASQTAQLEAERGELEQERARRKINSPFPEERPATKRSHAVTIRYGRWYEERSSLGVPNLDDFAVIDSDGEYLTITPKPYRGIPLAEEDHLASSIVSKLRSVDAEREYIDISIWDDSYKQFQPLRDYLVDNGFEYRLIVVTDGDEVVESYFVNPKVQ